MAPNASLDDAAPGEDTADQDGPRSSLAAVKKDTQEGHDLVEEWRFAIGVLAGIGMAGLLSLLAGIVRRRRALGDTGAGGDAPELDELSPLTNVCLDNDNVLHENVESPSKPSISPQRAVQRRSLLKSKGAKGGSANYTKLDDSAANNICTIAVAPLGKLRAKTHAPPSPQVAGGKDEIDV